MSEITTIGLDVAKQVFMRTAWMHLARRSYCRITRAKLIRFFASQPRCTVRWGRKNQGFPKCLQHAWVIWIRSANSHTGSQHSSSLHQKPDRWQDPMTVSDQSRNHLRRRGRPQMESGHSIHAPFRQGCGKATAGLEHH